MEEVTANKKKMKELEDNLLYRLTSTKVNNNCHSSLFFRSFACMKLTLYSFLYVPLLVLILSLHILDMYSI